MRTAAGDEHDRAIKLLRELFAYYQDHPDELPPEYHRVPGDLATRVADFIAGMTDRYAVRTYEQVFLPRRWLLWTGEPWPASVKKTLKQSRNGPTPSSSLPSPSRSRSPAT